MKQKTIFISISSVGAYRNLFLFPGSFFTQLKEFLRDHREYRAVILVPQREYEKYPHLFKEGYNELFFVEGIPVSISKGFIQRFFYFFYSYLLYTDTTAVLATMGMRPDEPPAGGKGKYLLGPLKRMIARTIGRSDWVRLHAVPFLFVRIFSRPFKSVFEKYEPDLVFASHLYGWFDTHMLAEATRMGVKTMGMPAGWDHLDKYYLPFHVDRLLAPSNGVRDAGIKFQSYASKDISVIGYPHFDFIASKSWAISRHDVLKELGLPADAKIVLYVSGSFYCPDEPDIIKEMAEWAERGELEGNVYFVIRLYPSGRSNRDFDEQKFEKLKSIPRISFYRPEVWTDIKTTELLLNIMLHADVVIQVYTTVALEATVLGRPLLSTPFDGYQQRSDYRSIRRFEKFEHFQDVIKSGALLRAYSFDQLREYLNRYLKDPSYLAREREQLCRDQCGPLDGKASRRVLEEILKYIDK
ncbi:MAG: hypothetical protein Q8R30_03990 [bacterium]|nr:hypothetical protein [bacterium]